MRGKILLITLALLTTTVGLATTTSALHERTEPIACMRGTPTCVTLIIAFETGNCAQEDVEELSAENTMAYNREAREYLLQDYPEDETPPRCWQHYYD